MSRWIGYGALMVAQRRRQPTTLTLLGVVVGAVLLPPARVGAHGLLLQRLAGADATEPVSPPINGETVVVLLREGNRTVLTFQNHYRGPAQDFAVIVPVPVALNPAEVHTLHSSVVEMVQRAAEPRLVELWEQDPCPTAPGSTSDSAAAPTSATLRQGFAAGAPRHDAAGTPQYDSAPVRVESEFQVGEYDVVVLGANDSLALEGWLGDQGYAVPEGAAAALRPYVDAGMKFLVAKVAVARLAALSPEHAAGLPAGHVALSPLRIQYDSERLELPLRLGLPNSPGEQDLTVHILSPEGRFAAANYRNRFVPTNQRASDAALADFPAAYALLFARLSRSAPRTVLSEFAGPVTPRRSDAACVGCARSGVPTAVLNALGATELPGHLPFTSEPGQARYAQFVLTRLRYRYGPNGVPEDMRFERAAPVAGGLEHAPTARALPSPARAPQDAYAVRFVRKHRFPGTQRCRNPRPSQWDGPG